ncbi:2-dehydro-3-deoxy-6-phosphogalactonate aldolase [Silvimonas iriomotensis]|uniref:2-dehydro-3-deoxy-6-phosphogalactonate aldolase n=1 Tax=Silvimonas iriomotensis TaxID=449662 RepID=A0ABQ2P3W2_9NEIS|nr:2-dehydro-3-deoxy-6-phosphogalactonate aldolase [Silvimonas iriomotensis]GGP17561.1 2-dehydro-3-deoxy-6-phosphogalactonate aldolase [Silvimonas iriomotensis]
MTWPTKLPLIAILRGITPAESNQHIIALIEAGFDAIEIPLNSPDWQISIGEAVNAFGDRALIGGGTVLTPQDVATLAGLGGKLIVTPNMDPTVITRAVALGQYMACGVATPTEAFAALAAGAQALKVFPAASFGPEYIKAIKAVLPKTTPVMAVGGVTPANLSTWLAAGCIGAGLGSDLYKPGQPVSRTQDQAQAFVQAYKDATA